MFRSMGCEVVVEGASPEALAGVRAVFERYDAVFSRFRPESELQRLNAAGGGLCRRSSARCSMSRSGRPRRRTGSSTRASARRSSRPATTATSPPGSTATSRPAPVAAPGGACDSLGPLLRLPAGVQLDLNGVVKALAVDRAAALLDGEGYVSAGGDLATRGAADVAPERRRRRARARRPGDERHHPAGAGCAAESFSTT